MHKVRLLVAAALAAALLVTSAVSASAQEQVQWLYNLRSGNYWWCAYYGSEFWCYTEQGVWIRTASPEMMQYV
jgi:hypothetical protein